MTCRCKCKIVDHRTRGTSRHTCHTLNVIFASAYILHTSIHFNTVQTSFGFTPKTCRLHACPGCCCFHSLQTLPYPPEIPYALQRQLATSDSLSLVKGFKEIEKGNCLFSSTLCIDSSAYWLRDEVQTYVTSTNVPKLLHRPHLYPYPLHPECRTRMEGLPKDGGLHCGRSSRNILAQL